MNSSSKHSLDAGRWHSGLSNGMLRLEYTKSPSLEKETASLKALGIISGPEYSKRAERRRMYGVYGEIDVNHGTYAVIIHEVRKVGTFMRAGIYEVKSVSLVHVSGVCDMSLRDTLDAFFRIPGLLFSDFPLADTGIQNNTDFIFNFIPASRFVQRHPAARKFVVCAIQGYFGEAVISGVRAKPAREIDQEDQVSPKSLSISCSILSRRSWRNAGTRFYARGADSYGHAANTVETLWTYTVEKENPEEDHPDICPGPSRTQTVLQCRGSVPLVWEQKINLSYKPPVLIGDPASNKYVFGKHLDVLRKRYADVFFLSLLDDAGHEKDLSEAFISALKEHGIKYYATNYHRMRKSGEEQKAFEKVLKEIADSGAVVRTNCIDCLDRTNVVQSQLARMKMAGSIRKWLHLQDEDASDMSQFYADAYMEEQQAKKISLLWTANANTLSMQYTGTSALKTDITKHGVRTLRGFIQDAISSGKRYVNNNFTDGKMQEAIEIITGVRSETGNSSRGGALIAVLFLVVAVAVYAGIRGRKEPLPLLFSALAAVAAIRQILFSALSYPSPRRFPRKSV